MVQVTVRERIGDLAGADAWFIEGESCFETSGFRRKPGAIAQTYGNAALVAALQGRRSCALRRIERAQCVAQDNANPYDVAFANHMAAMTFLTLRQPGHAHEAAQLSMSLSEEHCYPQFSAIARVALGRAMAEVEDATQGVALIRQGLEAMSRTKARSALTMYLVWLAEAQSFARSPGNAFATLGRALTVNPGERFYRPEALRLRGLLSFQMGDFDLGEADLRAALDLAKEIRAHGLALRAAHSLADVNVCRGRPERALDYLKEALSSTAVDPADPGFAEMRSLLDQIGSMIKSSVRPRARAS
jgi:tetratricopeptide (TPR) repeat protein